MAELTGIGAGLSAFGESFSRSFAAGNQQAINLEELELKKQKANRQLSLDKEKSKRADEQFKLDKKKTANATFKNMHQLSKDPKVNLKTQGIIREKMLTELGFLGPGTDALTRKAILSEAVTITDAVNDRVDEGTSIPELQARLADMGTPLEMVKFITAGVQREESAGLVSAQQGISPQEIIARKEFPEFAGVTSEETEREQLLTTAKARGTDLAGSANRNKAEQVANLVSAGRIPRARGRAIIAKLGQNPETFLGKDPVSDKPLTKKERQDTATAIAREARLQTNAQFTGTFGSINMDSLGKTPEEKARKYGELVNRLKRQMAIDRGLPNLFTTKKAERPKNPTSAALEKVRAGEITSSQQVLNYLATIGVTGDEAKAIAKAVTRESLKGRK